jgi:hypothetical protein
VYRPRYLEDEGLQMRTFEADPRLYALVLAFGLTVTGTSAALTQTEWCTKAAPPPGIPQPPGAPPLPAGIYRYGVNTFANEDRPKVCIQGGEAYRVWCYVSDPTQPSPQPCYGTGKDPCPLLPGEETVPVDPRCLMVSQTDQTNKSFDIYVQSNNPSYVSLKRKKIRRHN